MSTPIPKIIRLATRTYKDNKTLFYARNQNIQGHTRWNRWHSIVTSIEDYNKWKGYADIKYIVLNDITIGDVEFLETNKLIGTIPVLTTTKAMDLRPREYWQGKQNIIFL